MAFSFAALLLAQVVGSPAASPAPQPTQTPVPLVSIAPEFALYGFQSADVSDALLNITVTNGKLRATATAGAYSFPVVGFALVPDNAPAANVMLYSPLPVWALAYQFDSHVTLAAGKFASLLGQESPFTYQNINVQRGLAWNMEPVISRGVQLSYANGEWNTNLRVDDAYYSGSNRAFEGLIGWSPSANTGVQFAAMIPGPNTPPNVTTSIGNKREYNLMYTRTIGKMQLLPYVLWVNSPQSAILGYPHAERANAQALLGIWTFSPQWSVAFRYESARDGSSRADMSPNADLLGFGPGSSATSETVTPALHFGNAGVFRLEYSRVSATGLAQNRFGFELGVMH